LQQIPYNIFEQSPEDTLFPACHHHNIGVIVRVPLNEGGLTGTVTPESRFDPQAGMYEQSSLRRVYLH
jgi:aryl-alcohol dehydrogenase-like predicted oxidoreductase